MIDAASTTPIAIDAAGAAAAFCCSVRHWRSLDTEGKIPCPVRLGRSVRWISDELHAWGLAGCPPRLEWERRPRQDRLNKNAVAAGKLRRRQTLVPSDDSQIAELQAP